MVAPTSGDDSDEDERFLVVYKCVVFRKQPSTKAEMVYVAKQGTTFSGKLHSFNDGQEWVHISAADCKERHIVGMEAWVLVHGECVGLGDLLRPQHQDVEHIEELLWRMSSERGHKVRPIASALRAAGLRKGSAFLMEAQTRADLQHLQETVFDNVLNRGCVIPDDLVGKIKMAVEDSRLAFECVSDVPTKNRMRILFTAPHSLPLCREGHEAHQPEAFTSRLAKDLARGVGGAFLVWASSEERRALEVFRQQGQPDPSNKDPNFTRREDMFDSPWTRNLREVKQLFGVGQPCLHVDLHGCKDPSAAGGSDMVIGFRANELAGRVGVEALRSALWLALSIALRGVSINVRPQRQLTGAALEDDFCTLSQQSLDEAGGAWTCAVQIELSRSLRQMLMNNRDARKLMAEAIGYAWTIAVGECADPPATLHALQYWLAKCKAFYNRTKDGTFLGGPPAAGESAAGEPPDGRAEEEREDREDREVMEAVVDTTANSEARAPLPDAPPSTLEAEIIRAFRTVEKRAPRYPGTPGVVDTANVSVGAWRPSPAALLRDWLRAPADVVEGALLAPSRPEERFAIMGSWNGFQPQEMAWDGAQFVYTVTITQRCWESFHIRCEDDSERVLYPSVQGASPYMEHKLCGPGINTQGKTWCIGLATSTDGAQNVARPGQRYRIALVVVETPVFSGICTPREVVWDLLGVRGLPDFVWRSGGRSGGGAEAPAPAVAPAPASGSTPARERGLAGGSASGEDLLPQRRSLGSPRASGGAETFVPPPRGAASPTAKTLAPASLAAPMSELEFVIHIDRTLDLEVSLRLEPGATVAELKAAIAAMDPTGATRPENFELRLAAAAAEAPPLDAALVLTAKHTELDIFSV